MRASLRRLAGPLVAIALVSNAVAPGAHGCPQRSQASASSDAHHGARQHPTRLPADQGSCHCVGVACCSPVSYTPVYDLRLAAVALTTWDQGGETETAAYRSRTKHLLPLAQAPPHSI